VHKKKLIEVPLPWQPSARNRARGSIPHGQSHHQGPNMLRREPMETRAGRTTALRRLFTV
jgi:hypothetical protein